MMIHRVIKRIQRHFRRPDRYYKIDGFTLDMGDNHLLSLYQEDCRLYSRFIPYLAELANEIRGEQGTIIDLGANVGDTVAAMIRHTPGKVLCIEPADEYYKLLKKNIEAMQIASRVVAVQAFISNQKKNYQVIVSGGGTGVQQEYLESKIPTFSLPELFDQYNIAMNDVSVIKTSTSGNDAGAILSLGDSLREMNPVFYIESSLPWGTEKDVCNSHLVECLRMDDYFVDHGYECCFVFDNFGNYLCKVKPDTLKEMHQYIYRMEMRKSNRTFYYLYVLACRKNIEGLCSDAVRRYVEDYA